ncbi:MAG TPA: polyamine ABC transporter substrate-binding protein [Alphaproteobacteria bacterium]|jgi:putrescine transport system substrate-binding protein|nr:polyamine ABC transporter substrate-binding protein [Alphaproteobacteria bacterium]
MRKIWAAALGVLAVGVLAAVALAPLAAPARAEDKGTLNIYNWNDYIDPKTLERFTAETGIKVRYDVYDTNETLDAKLRAGNSGYDLVVPTASPFLANQIPADLYRPLDKTKLKNYGNLDPTLMKQLAKYDPGNRHAIPWMWGTTGLGYNVQRIKAIMPDAPTNSLRMLLDPAVIAKFKECGVLVLDSPTDVIPAVLAYLGRDPDSHSDEDLEAATRALVAIRPYVRKWHSSEYINDLANGDACLAFGFSGDIKQAAKRAEDAKKPYKVDYAIPAEGAQVWIDTWAIPADAPHIEAAYKFLDFVLRPDIAALNSNFIGYANAVPASKAKLDPSVRDDPTVYPPDELRERFYTLTPPDRAYERKRTRAWTRVTTGQ